VEENATRISLPFLGGVPDCEWRGDISKDKQQEAVRSRLEWQASTRRQADKRISNCKTDDRSRSGPVRIGVMRDVRRVRHASGRVRWRWRAGAILAAELTLELTVTWRSPR
jgi:hypothetical protein